MLERIIFSVDNAHDLYHYSKAVHTLDVLRAMGDIGKPVPCIGCYDGCLEPSFMVTAPEWEIIRHRARQYLIDQASVLRVPGDVRQPCVLEFLHGNNWQTLGPMRAVDNPQDYKGWTYVIETGLYFSCDQ